jgi:hypothetical protein
MSSETCAECGLDACHSKTCGYLKRLEAIYMRARALMETREDDSMTMDRLTVELGAAVAEQIKMELASRPREVPAGPSKVDRAMKRFQVQPQSAAHYRVPFNNQAWAESLAREYELSDKERLEFITRLRQEVL